MIKKLKKNFGKKTLVIMNDETAKSHNDYKIISLGYNCLPRTFLTRAGLKPTKDEGELSMPFDLTVHKEGEVTKLLRCKFKGYFDNLIFDERQNNWVKRKYKLAFNHGFKIGKNDRIVFNHDLDLKKNKRALVERYSKRIKNFWSCINDDAPILFVQAIELESDVNNLYEELRKIRKDKPFELVVIDIANLVKKHHENINVLKVPFPQENYIWFKEEFFNSPEGIEFEKKIIDFCKKILVEKLNIKNLS